nr:phosphatidylglycerol lysyltransferase domain-containing protein [Angustibacter aerolatus]
MSQGRPDVGGAGGVRRRVPALVAWVVRGVALLSLLALLTPDGERHRHDVRDAVTDGTALAVVIALAAVMLVLARALSHRKRRAWRVVLGLVLVAAVLYLRVRQWEAAGLNLAMAALLVWTREEFRAQAEPASRWTALRAAVLMGSVSFFAGLAITARTAPDATGWAAVRETLRGLVGLVPDLPYRRRELGDLTSVALTGLGVATVGVVLVVLLTPRRKPALLLPEDEARVRVLLDRHGDRDSLGYFALRRDKTVLTSPSGKAAVAYRVVGGVSLAAGDPLGDPEAWPGAIAAWLAEAQRYAWTPGVLGASQEGATAYVRAGLDALEIGDEAVLDLTTFSLQGREMRVVRQAVARAVRAGYAATACRQRDLDEAGIAEATAAVDAFRDGEVERGFSMALGRVGDAADPDVVVVRARDGEGRLVAVLTLVPWGSDGLSLDVMRRARDSENGTMEPARRDAGRAGAGPRRPAGVAELRGVPLGARARRPGGRRAGAAAVAVGAAVGLALVADRVALPRERQVPPRLGAAHGVLPAGRRPAAGSRRRVAGGGVRGAARPAALAAAAALSRLRRAGSSSRAGPRCGRTARRAASRAPTP